MFVPEHIKQQAMQPQQNEMQSPIPSQPFPGEIPRQEPGIMSRIGEGIKRGIMDVPSLPMQLAAMVGKNAVEAGTQSPLQTLKEVGYEAPRAVVQNTAAGIERLGNWNKPGTPFAPVVPFYNPPDAAKPIEQTTEMMMRAFPAARAEEAVLAGAERYIPSLGEGAGIAQKLGRQVATRLPAGAAGGATFAGLSGQDIPQGAAEQGTLASLLPFLGTLGRAGLTKFVGGIGERGAPITAAEFEQNMAQVPYKMTSEGLPQFNKQGMPQQHRLPVGDIANSPRLQSLNATANLFPLTGALFSLSKAESTSSRHDGGIGQSCRATRNWAND